MTDQTFSINQRLRVGSHLATVRYCGPIKGQSGIWVGLEWDDASRGKHYGTVAGNSYFTCIYSPENAASCVRLERLLQSAAKGNDLPTALHSHYCESTTEVAKTKSKGAVELVGLHLTEERQKQVDKHTKISLQDLDITQLGDMATLSTLLPACQDLDLTGNLLHPQQAIITLAQALPNLTSLNLSNNRLAWAPGPSGGPPNLRVLILNDTLLPWSSVLGIARCLPNLRQLHLCRNRMDTLACGEGDLQQCFAKLEVLDLDDNSLSNWDEMLQLGCLSALTTMQLNSNRFSRLSAVTGSAFPKLNTLLLGGNSIATWQDVSALNSFAALQDIRLSDNPVLQDLDAVAGRLTTIARLGKIMALNGSPVHPLERRDAEIWYLRSLAGQAASTEEAAAQLAQEHPRLQELMQKYSIQAQQQPQVKRSLASTMCELTMKHGETSITKRIPVTMTVARLKLLGRRLLKLKQPPAQLLLQVEGRGTCAEDVTSYDTKPLEQLGAQHSATLMFV